MSFIPYSSVNPEEDERLPPLYFRPIPQQNLEAANIAHLPSAYVKDELRALRHRSVALSLVTTETNIDRYRLWQEASSQIIDPEFSWGIPARIKLSSYQDRDSENTCPPTHCIALPSWSDSAVFLSPVHSIVLASQCTNLPPIIHSTPPYANDLQTLPITLPYPRGFDILWEWLYMRDEALLVQQLLSPRNGRKVEYWADDEVLRGMSPAYDLVDRARFKGLTFQHFWANSSRLAENVGWSLELLEEHKEHGRRGWENVLALGICDEELVRAFDLVWEVCKDAWLVIENNDEDMEDESDESSEDEGSEGSEGGCSDDSESSDGSLVGHLGNSKCH